MKFRSRCLLLVVVLPACLAAFNLFFDRTGSDLYVMELNDSDQTNTASFAVDKSSGSLNWASPSATSTAMEDSTFQS
jgi:hypothetical protein